MSGEKKIQKITLIILEGWGVAPPSKGNAIALSKTPNIDSLIRTYPVGILEASGEYVGLLKSQQGNAVSGHLNIGAGRVVYREGTEIDQAIDNGMFNSNEVLLEAIAKGSGDQFNLHIIVPLRVDDLKYLDAILNLLKKKTTNAFFHIILGNDRSYNNGINLIDELDSKLEKNKLGSILTICGCDYAMDSNNNWKMIELAYRAIVEGQSDKIYETAREAVKSSYDNQIFDNEMAPVIIDPQKDSKIKSGDSVIFISPEIEKMCEFVKALSLPTFRRFERDYLKDVLVTTMVEYDLNLPVAVAFPPEKIKNTLSEVVSLEHLDQIKIAETERYAHLTYFFNGQNERFEGETQKMIPAQSTGHYNKSPEMSLRKVMAETTSAIMADQYSLIVVDIANPDLVAHSGDLKATIKACEAVDTAIGKISDLVLAKGGVLVIVASHGNAEEMINLQSGETDKDHNIYPVPFLVVGEKWEGTVLGNLDIPGTDLSLLKPIGSLADVAPTILSIMGIKIPKEMTGKNLT